MAHSIRMSRREWQKFTARQQAQLIDLTTNDRKSITEAKMLVRRAAAWHPEADFISGNRISHGQHWAHWTGPDTDQWRTYRYPQDDSSIFGEDLGSTPANKPAPFRSTGTNPTPQETTR